MARGPELAGLTIGAEPAAWAAAGFDVDDDGMTCVGGVALRFDGGGDDGDGTAGIRAWALRSTRPPEDIDGLVCEPPAEPRLPGRHPNGACGVDHVVVATPALARTLAALADAGFDLRRTRDVPDRGLRQAFYRMGEVVLEVVGTPDGAGEGRASFWGLVVVVPDLDALAARLGAHAATPRPAVQPGRRIVTVLPAARLATHVAFMSPAPQRASVPAYSPGGWRTA